MQCSRIDSVDKITITTNLPFPYKIHVQFVFTSSCLQGGSCLIYVICVCLFRLYHQLFVGEIMSYLRYLCLFVSSLPPVVCRRDHVLFTLFVFVSAQWFPIRVITKLPNSEQSSKGKVKTHKYINRQNQENWENIVLCFWFVFLHLHPILPVSQDCLFFYYPSPPLSPRYSLTFILFF